MRAKIDCVAITDHNVADWIDPLRAALSALQDELPADFRPLHLFPAIEISLYGNVHLLAIFDPQLNGSHVTRFLGAAGLHGSDPKSAQQCSEKSLLDISRLINEHGGIAIPPHVDKNNGVFRTAHQTSPPTLAELSNVHAIEVVDRSFPERGSLHSTLGSKPAVLGSDSHHASGADGQRFPGSHFTWVKMGTPSIEGLRLALIDGHPLSIRRSDESEEDPNSHPTTFIKRLHLVAAKYAGNGRRLEVNFSPWLTSIIGGRGAGKSTLVEMIRLCLRREDELPKRLKDHFRKFSSVPTSRSALGALTERTEIGILLEKGAVEYRILWDMKGKLEAISRRASGQWVPEVGEVRDRFDVRIFSQRQILEMATDCQAILYMIDDNTTFDSNALRTRQNQLESRFLRLRSEIRELRSNTRQRTRVLGVLAELDQQINLIESGNNQETLIAHRRIERQTQIVRKLVRELTRTVASIRELADTSEPADVRKNEFFSDDAREARVLKWLIEATNKQSEFAKSFRRLADALEDFSYSWELKVTSYHNQTREEMRRRFNQLMDRLKAAGVDDASQYASLLQQRHVTRFQLEELDHLRAKIEELEKEARNTITELINLRNVWNEARRSFLTQILRENPHVRIDIVPFGREAHEQESMFRAAFQCDDDRFKNAILSGDRSTGMLADLYRDLPSSDNERTAELVRRLSQLKAKIRKQRMSSDNSRFGRHIRRLTPEQIDRIELWQPADSVVVKYRRPDGRGWSPIEGGSPGQQAAALLALILAHGDEPLILDQPEDDLDNRLVFDLVVQQVRMKKRLRQIIVVTHNPNIVVNGDAEAVIEMDFQNGQCVVVDKGTGCLQDQGTRSTICRIMEGGIDAFKTRHRRLIASEK